MAMNDNTRYVPSTPPFDLLERTELEVMAWANSKGRAVHCMHWLPAFIWPGSVSVWVFAKSNAELDTWHNESWVDGLKERLITALIEQGLSEDIARGLEVVVDSDQNVQENYEGSYFYRLR